LICSSDFLSATFYQFQRDPANKSSHRALIKYSHFSEQNLQKGASAITGVSCTFPYTPTRRSRNAALRTGSHGLAKKIPKAMDWAITLLSNQLAGHTASHAAWLLA
jgi:hypothetical protein